MRAIIVLVTVAYAGFVFGELPPLDWVTPAVEDFKQMVSSNCWS